MKKILYLLTMLAALLVFNGCQKDEPISQLVIEPPQSMEKPDVYVENGYLVFKDYPVFAKISDNLSILSEENIKKWGNRLGFISARTIYLEANSLLENVKNKSEFDMLKHRYEGKLIFTEDGDIRYPFYATSWDNVLNIDGVVKIGNTLYKFYKDRQLMIMDGTFKDLKNILTLQSDTNKVKIFYPNKLSQLKSVQWGSLIIDDLKTGNSKGDSWLFWDYQLISLYYTGYGYGSTYYTENGFELRIKLEQKRKGIFGWYVNETQFNIRNDFLHIEFWKMYPGVYIYPKYVFCQNLPDYTSPESKGLTYVFMRYYDVISQYYPQVIAEINNHNFRFWSRGIGEGNVQTINYSNM